MLYLHRYDDFKMFAIWKFEGATSPNSIWVPLRVTRWGWFANVDPLEWDGLPHAVNPPSEDTTEVPEWDASIKYIAANPYDDQ
jgi:hypothetical protein